MPNETVCILINKLNEIMHILGTCGMKFDMFLEYAEFVMLTDRWYNVYMDNTQNKI